MKKEQPATRSRYRSALRREQAQATRERIRRAAAALLDHEGATGGITFRAVAQRAGVTEMTVYRHFPTREALLRGVWESLNEHMAPTIGMPDSERALLAQHDALFRGFDRIAPQIVASISTPQGREMRSALDAERRRAFLGIVEEAAPQLAKAQRVRAAAVLQLLHSAYAWASLREQWELTGAQAGQATRWAIETLLDNLRTHT